MTLVSVQRAERYEPERLDRAIAAHFEQLGVEKDLRPGMRVLIKPNLLAGRDPATAVTWQPWAAGCARTGLRTSLWRTALAGCIRRPCCARCTPPAVWSSCARS